jgi:hypothetical protein
LDFKYYRKFENMEPCFRWNHFFMRVNEFRPVRIWDQRWGICPTIPNWSRLLLCAGDFGDGEALAGDIVDNH